VIEGRWYITERAAREYCSFRKWPATEANVERATAELIELSRVARFSRLQDNGLELWRVRSNATRQGHRFLVGEPPRELRGGQGDHKLALISVRAEHGEPPRRR